MRITSKALLAVVALAALGPAPALAQAWAEKMFKVGDKLVTTHDFGSVPRGAQLYHRFKITNIYAVPMDIVNIRASCGCVTVTPSARTLQPREEGWIEIKMDTTRFTGPKTVSVHVTVGPQFTSTAELKVSAVSRGDVVFNPGQASFGVVQRGQTPSQSVDVEYAGKLDWKVTEVLTNNAPLTATFEQAYRRPGQVGYKIKVTLKPDAPAGPLKHELFLRTNDPASPLVPLLVEAHVQAALTVNPSSYNLGTLTAGQSKTFRVSVSGSKPFRITSVESAGDGVSAEFADGAGATRLVTIKCQPTQAGPFKRVVRIKTDLDGAIATVVVEGNVAP